MPSDSLNPLDAIGPVDGRYRPQTEPLSEWFGEGALIRRRVLIEIAWLKVLHPLLAPNVALEDGVLDAMADNENLAAEIKLLEKTTRHDVKAVEYWLARQLEKRRLSRLRPLVHFACTSWDINNLAQSTLIRDAWRGALRQKLNQVVQAVRLRAHEFADDAMLSRTHGQPASPTTMGKEFANFLARLNSCEKKISAIQLGGKMNGATGNYNAHFIAYPNLDWENIAKEFVTAQGLLFSSHTTQIEPYDGLAEWFDALRRVNVVLLDFCRDIWGYIALDYFGQMAAADEVGSSTMPHKINPIDFENAEGNLGVANALLSHFSDKLPVSRWQRDLSDSTVARNIGCALAHSFLAWQSAATGIGKLTLNRDKLNADLDDNWQVLAEAAQTVMRAEGLGDGYDLLKQFSRGRKVNKEQMQEFIRQLPLSPAAKDGLLRLTPHTYTGLAAKLARDC